MRLLLLFVFLAQISAAQYDKDNPHNSHCNWTNTVLNKNYVPAPGDTCLYVVSTRHYHETQTPFVDNEFDSTGTLTYLAIYYHGDTWTAVPKSSMEELLSCQAISPNLVVYTEGLGRTFTTDIDRGTRMSRIYGVQTLLFDWPTERPDIKAGQNFRISYTVSKLVAQPFARCAKEIASYKEAHISRFSSINLFFHSMGNLIIMHALQQNYLEGLPSNAFQNVILNAACVPEKAHKAWVEKIQFAQHIYLTRNKHDKNLNGAKIILWQHQLGERPRKPFAANAIYVTFSKVLGLEHNYFLMRPLLKQKPYLKDFYKSLFNGEEAKFEKDHFKPESKLNQNLYECLPKQGDFAIGLG